MTKTTLKIQILKDNEKFTFPEWAWGYTQKCQLDVWTELKPKSYQRRLVSQTTKDNRANNPKKSTYGYVWLIVVNDELYKVELSLWGKDFSIVGYGAKTLALTEEEDKQAREDLKILLPEVYTIIDLHNKASEKFQEREEQTRKEHAEVYDEEIKEHILNIDNWKPIKFDKNYKNNIFIKFACKYYSKNIYTDKQGRLTEKLKNQLAEEHKTELKSWLDKFNSEHIFIGRREDNSLYAVKFSGENLTVLF